MAWEKWEDVPTFSRINPVNSSVATTATQILQFNERRVSWVIINKAVNTGHFAFDATVSTTYGVTVPSSGGFISANRREDGYMIFLPVFAITETATGTWWIVETVMIRDPIWSPDAPALAAR